MPYIRPEEREFLNEEVAALAKQLGAAGDANYAITTLLLQAFPTKSYENYNRVIGILECAKLEFYRRAVAAYEDEKIQSNGDVY